MYVSKKGFLLLFIAGVLMLPGCSRKTLSLFFDGVPPAGDSVASTSTYTKSLADTVQTLTDTVKTIAAERSSHPPYAQKKCSLCHDNSRKGKRNMEQPWLCNTCHVDYRVLYKNLHGPAAGGYCTSCHDPHEAANKRLLIRKGQDLCLFCHDQKIVHDHPAHQNSANVECTECHDPHGSNKPRFLK